METWQAIVLGLIQGLTEFLPVSSSGHLELARVFLGVEEGGNLSFVIALHGATFLSTIVALWSEIWQLLRGLFAFRWNWQTEYVAKIVLSMIPVALVGFFLKDYLDTLFTGNLLLVGTMLMLTALLLWLTGRRIQLYRIRHQPTYAIALGMGVAQTQSCTVLLFDGLAADYRDEPVRYFRWLVYHGRFSGFAFFEWRGDGLCDGLYRLSLDALLGAARASDMVCALLCPCGRRGNSRSVS